MATSPTSGPGFNGGTLTQTLNIDPASISGLGTVLQLNGVSIAGNNVLQVDDSGGNDVFTVADDGTTVLFMREAGSVVYVRDVVNGNILALSLDPSTQVLSSAYALATSKHSAPADGSLDAGQAALWFDQTDGVGNTKLMVKGKSADGTVKTATILLA